MSEWKPTTIDEISEGVLAALDAIAPYWAEDFGREEALEWIEGCWLDIRREPLTPDVWAHRCLAALEEGAEAQFA